MVSSETWFPSLLGKVNMFLINISLFKNGSNVVMNFEEF